MVKKNNSFVDLRVWEHAVALTEQCYRLTKNFPKEELFGMVSQIRRSATSIAVNIAEGCAREGKKEFVQFLAIAVGSAAELKTHIIIAQRVSLISVSESEALISEIDAVAKQLHALKNAIRTQKD